MDFIARIECDEISASLGPMVKISRALGCRLGTFIDDVYGGDPLIVRVAERQESLDHTEGAGVTPKATFYSLGAGKSDRHMEPFYISLPPDDSEKKLSSHQGEEFIVVLSGQVALVYGQETKVLNPGDSAYYNSVVPHHVGAAGEETAEIYAVVYIPF